MCIRDSSTCVQRSVDTRLLVPPWPFFLALGLFHFLTLPASDLLLTTEARTQRHTLTQAASYLFFSKRIFGAPGYEITIRDLSVAAAPLAVEQQKPVCGAFHQVSFSISCSVTVLLSFKRQQATSGTLFSVAHRTSFFAAGGSRTRPVAVHCSLT